METSVMPEKFHFLSDEVQHNAACVWNPDGDCSCGANAKATVEPGYIFIGAAVFGTPLYIPSSAGFVRAKEIETFLTQLNDLARFSSRPKLLSRKEDKPMPKTIDKYEPDPEWLNKPRPMRENLSRWQRLVRWWGKSSPLDDWENLLR